MDELRKKIWNEAVRSAIKAFASTHPDIGLPYEIECLDTNAAPVGETKQVSRVPRLLHLEINADERGEPTWDTDTYPKDFPGGSVRFLVESSRLTICEELAVDLKFPTESNPNEKSAAEGETAATA